MFPQLVRPKESFGIRFIKQHDPVVFLLQDLNDIFNWNVKQLFVYLTAEYETSNNVSFWHSAVEYNIILFCVKKTLWYSYKYWWINLILCLDVTHVPVCMSAHLPQNMLYNESKLVCLYHLKP